jgi:hypothetical protein
VSLFFSHMHCSLGHTVQLQVRIVLCTLSSASGAAGVPFFHVSGLSEAEMPGDAIVVFKAIGMGGHASISPLAALEESNHGFIVFSKATPGASVGESPTGIVAGLYNTLVINPFLTASRTMLGMQAGSKPTVAHSAVLFADGCGAPRVAAVRPECEQADDDNLLTRCKSHRSRTAIVQVEDHRDNYKVKKAQAKTMSTSTP